MYTCIYEHKHTWAHTQCIGRFRLSGEFQFHALFSTIYTCIMDATQTLATSNAIRLICYYNFFFLANCFRSRHARGCKLGGERGEYGNRQQRFAFCTLTCASFGYIIFSHVIFHNICILCFIDGNLSVNRMQPGCAGVFKFTEQRNICVHWSFDIEMRNLNTTFMQSNCAFGKIVFTSHPKIDSEIRSYNIRKTRNEQKKRVIRAQLNISSNQYCILFLCCNQSARRY